MDQSQTSSNATLSIYTDGFNVQHAGQSWKAGKAVLTNLELKLNKTTTDVTARATIYSSFGAANAGGPSLGSTTSPVTSASAVVTAFNFSPSIALTIGNTYFVTVQIVSG